MAEPAAKRFAHRSFSSGLPLALGLLLLTRCSGANSLTGSVSDIFPTAFNSVSVWSNKDSFQVSYYFTEYAQESIVVQLSVDTSGLSFGPGKTVDLASTTDAGSPRATVTHESYGEAVVVLPPIQEGSLSLSSGGLDAGQVTSGSFNLSFVNNGHVGSGYTVSGTFDQRLISANFLPDANYPADAGPQDGGCIAEQCVGTCSAHQVCCALGPGIVKTGAACTSDCSCIDLSCDLGTLLCQ